MTNYLRIPLSTKKRHFVVGDIHGRYATFLNLLEEIEYNKETDIIYSVGDLIDRGEDSVATVEFFKQSNTHAVLGNHEQMIVNQRDWRDIWMYPPNGGPATLASLKEYGYELKWLENFCKKLPICIDVGEEDEENAFRIIHAECPSYWPEDYFREYLIQYPDDAPEGDLLWGRKTVQEAVRNVKNMKLAGDGIKFAEPWTTRNVFCGHTPTQGVIRVGNMRWIDTFWGGTMTMMNAVTLDKFSVPMVFPDANKVYI